MEEVVGDAHVSHRQEAFAGAYIRAVCATIGYSISKPETDHDKVDFIISSREKGSVLNKPKIDLQSKCRMSGIATEDPIAYSIDIETYNNLRDSRVSNPRLLILTLVPNSTSGWMSQSEEQLVLKHCSYWISLKGQPETKNSTGITVYFPRANLFTPISLKEMMIKTGNGEDL
ncbi:hypothetical protein ABAC460_14445 [Asticcacaulis sp. AC460]|uniref:DUF4365 domain-containing protein n=1 Tax=Asticcacaulis sp. AC460 TaxID=1282360 RepID=UPI0003C3C507|nr:DUF4365 domain-containing protein [Asticcacaulis sp. AC460]ESQ88977.1 hypothetical protein ABAC460_14445 [Asticcacaulis sp. AC460]